MNDLNHYNLTNNLIKNFHNTIELRTLLFYEFNDTVLFMDGFFDFTSIMPFI